MRSQPILEFTAYQVSRGQRGKISNCVKGILIALLPFLVLFSEGSDRLFGGKVKGRPTDSGTLEKMIVANGSVSLDLNLNGARTKGSTELQFLAEADSFFTIVAFNGELRGAMPGSMALVPQNSAVLPAKLNASYRQLVVERLPWSAPYELAIRDGKTGFVFFNIEGHEVGYDPNQQRLDMLAGRLLLSDDFAAELGRPSEAGSVVGSISITATMRTIEMSQIVEGEVKSEVLPATRDPEAGTVPGPDVVVGDLPQLIQSGSSGSQVGLAVGTDSCNFGTIDLNWFANPNSDHPVIPQNLYRLSGGATNDQRFEQISQSNVKQRSQR